MINTFLVSAISKSYQRDKIIDSYTEEENSILAATSIDDPFPSEILDKNITLEFIQQADVLKFTFKQENVVKYKLNLNLDTIKSSAMFADQTYWAIKSKTLKEKCTNVENVYNLTAFDVVEFSSVTLASKTSYDTSNFPHDSRNYDDKNNTFSTPFRIFIPSINSSLSDCKIIISNPVRDLDTDSTIVTVTGDVNVVNLTPEITTNAQQTAAFNETQNAHWDWRSLISNITLSSTVNSYSAGDDIIVNVTTEDTTISKIYLEPVVGILNKQQVSLTNGVGSFIIKTDSLQSGDTVRVKAGYKYFTGVSVFTKTLT